MEKAKRKYINAIRKNKEFTKETMEFFDALNKYLAEVEWENTEKEYVIVRLLGEINFYVDIMKSYGIDIGKLGGRSFYSIQSQIQSELLTIPENLIDYDRRKRNAGGERLSILQGLERRHLTVFGRNERTNQSRKYTLGKLR